MNKHVTNKLSASPTAKEIAKQLRTLSASELTYIVEYATLLLSQQESPPTYLTLCLAAKQILGYTWPPWNKLPGTQRKPLALKLEQINQLKLNRRGVYRFLLIYLDTFQEDFLGPKTPLNFGLWNTQPQSFLNKFLPYPEKFQKNILNNTEGD